MTAYTPQPGTLVDRAVKHLRTLKAGQTISTAELCAELGQPSSSLIPSLQPARNHGLVSARHLGDDKRTLRWSIGDGKPIAVVNLDDEPEPEDDFRVKKSPTPAPPISARSVFDAALDRIRTADVTPEAPRTAQDWMRVAAEAVEGEQDAPRHEAVTEAAQDTGKDSTEGHAEQRPPAGERAARFALWSDGTLQIETGTSRLELAREETRALIGYLDVMGGREAAA